jgi:deoxyribodipyrimidine photo-lyase
VPKSEVWIAVRIVALVRRELRLDDNPLWQHADGRNEVIPLFVLDDFNQREHGDNLRSLFFFALKSLRERIAERSGRLFCIHSSQQEAFFATVKPDLVLFCEDQEPHSRERDEQLCRLLDRLGIRYQVLRDSTIVPMPDRPFTTFTQFYKRHFLPSLPDCLVTFPSPKNFNTPRLAVPEVPLPEVRSDAAVHWLADEEGVQQKWRRFVCQGLGDYAERRNLLTDYATSRMSPYIRCGLISLRQMAQEAMAVSEAFLRELAWHDFYAHLLHHFPETSETEWKSEWRGFPWRHDEKAFEVWCQGQTGIPLVDAGMRQLRQEGWLPNRVRMVVASFLTKHLQIDWRWGERHFYRQLVDADLAQNVGNWQWVAGCGADAAPYFRIFNPILQARKFDPNGDYIRRYVAELSHVPNDVLHDLERLRSFAPDYPPPIVDLERGRKTFMELARRHFAS